MSEKNAETSKYFRDLAQEIHDRRVQKADYTPEELKIYHEAKKDAFREVLMLFNQSTTQKRTYIEHIWGEHELKNMIEIHVKSLNDKLLLARRIFLQQKKEIAHLQKTQDIS